MKYSLVKTYGLLAVSALIGLSAQATDEDRFLALEQQIAAAQAEIAVLKGKAQDLGVLEPMEEPLTFGGYGEIHANLQEGGDDQIDLHRLVMYVGYQFSDWIKLNAEVEIEHAFISDGDGEISVEQLYVDFLLNETVNLRAGRILAPLGIINQHHEPVLFNGVERPNVEKNIIPSTWSLDGIGLFGSPLSWLSYELYVVAGLDDDGFSAGSGIRGGRIKERQGLNDGAVTGRIDVYPLVTDNQNLRFGLSGYYGGTNNENKGGTNSNDSNNTFSMVSADAEYEISRLQLRGVVAHGTNSEAEELAAGVGEEIFGWYLEAGFRVLPEAWKSGKLAEADLIPFIRYERYDTQYELAGGAAATGANDKTDITVGANLLLTRDFVIKADIQFADNEASGSDTVTKYNLGLGWVFN